VRFSRFQKSVLEAGAVVLLVWTLWNWLAPTFTMPQLNPGQAMGMVLLCRLLFGTVTRHDKK